MRKLIYLLALALGMSSMLNSCQELTDPNESKADVVRPVVHIAMINYTDWDGSVKDLSPEMYPLMMNFYEDSTHNEYNVTVKEDLELPERVIYSNFSNCAAFTPAKFCDKQEGLGIIHFSLNPVNEVSDILCATSSLESECNYYINLKHVLARICVNLELAPEYADDSLLIENPYIKQNPDDKILPSDFDYNLDGKYQETCYNDIYNIGSFKITKQNKTPIMFYVGPATASGTVQLSFYINNIEAKPTTIDIDANQLQSGNTLYIDAYYSHNGLRISDVKLDGWHNNNGGDIDI